MNVLLEDKVNNLIASIEMSGTDRPKALIKSLNRHRWASRFSNMHKTSVLLQIVPWLHVIFSDNPRTEEQCRFCGNGIRFYTQPLGSQWGGGHPF